MLQAWLEKVLGNSYLTSLIGIVAGVVNALIPILQSGRMPTLNEWMLSVFMAIAGMAAKSFNVTGSNKDKGAQEKKLESETKQGG